MVHFALEPLCVELLYLSNTLDFSTAHQPAAWKINSCCNRTRIPWILAVKQSREWHGPPEGGACGLKWLDVFWPPCQLAKARCCAGQRWLPWRLQKSGPEWSSNSGRQGVDVRACGFSSFHQNMNQCLDFSTFFFHVSIETDNKKKTKRRGCGKYGWSLDFMQCLWPGYESIRLWQLDNGAGTRP